ncbi:uncharacterized protein LOC114535317 [Dendronephthya gigantea]|uniref:uncharacterized protein LOC114535317 n=1 Tax=Dendronephthya gigantea TaxID=151771 RepID=UPI00106B330A|nr:uncharacterized protein LOC114535317 [Dendronephthya gigantea]
MSEDLDESLPLQYLESMWSGSEEDLETSMQNLSLNDEDYDPGKRRTSTPIQLQEEGSVTVESPTQGKHTLTPSSKEAPLPQSKKVCVGKFLSGKQRTDRRKAATFFLKEGFELHDNSQTPYETVVAYLGDDTITKSMLTRTVKEAFPGVYIKRERKDNKKQVFFMNLQEKGIAHQFSDVRHDEIEANDDIQNLLTNLELSDLVLSQIWSSIVSKYNEGGDISGQLADYAKESRKREVHINNVINLFKEEIEKLKHNVPDNTLSDKQKHTIKLEMKEFEDICDTEIRGSSVLNVSDTIDASLFKETLEAVKEKCPLIYSMVQSLVISNPASRNLLKTNTHKMVCGVHMLGIISNIRNQRTRNCFPLIFGLLCVTFGAGKQFIDMLQSIGLSLHWNTIISFMDKRLAQFQSLIEECAPISKPIILLIDNINMYHGNRTHHRLFKVLGPKMWNFTVRGLAIPDLTTIEHLFNEKETAEEQQKDKVTAWDTFIETNKEHLKLWNEVQDNFLLKLLNTSLNCIPSSEKDFVNMDEKEFDHWLKNFSKSTTDYGIVIPPLSIRPNPNCTKSETLILPLSLEDNSTTTGTAAILEEFGKEFDIPCDHAKVYLPFDDRSKTFDLKAAREHHVFISSLHEHKSTMTKTVQQLREAEKAFELPSSQTVLNSDTSNGTRSQQKMDGEFKHIFDRLVQRMWEAQQHHDPSKFHQFISWLDSN